jgi:hypothetical protein
MNKTTIKTVALTFVVAVTGYVVMMAQAMAQTDPATTPQEQRVDNRQARQAGRIAAGTASGELTPREQRRLQRQQTMTARMEQHAEADGVVTRKEAARLEHQQDHNSRAIRRQKHDPQHRP